MEERKLQAAAKYCLIMLTVVCMISLGTAVSRHSAGYASADTELKDAKIPAGVDAKAYAYEQIRARMQHTDGELYTNLATKEAVEEIGVQFMALPKTEDPSLEISLSDLYMEQKVRICLSGLREKCYTKEDVFWSREAGGILKKTRLTYGYDSQQGTYSAIFEFTLQQVYAYRLFEDSKFIYLEFRRPREAYDSIVIVDAGHGGDDTGTYSDDLGYLEKDINLKVCLAVKELLDQQDGIKTYYTRLTDQKVYLNPRLKLAEDLGADLFLSIHCNASEYVSAQGTETLYRQEASGEVDSRRGGLTSKVLAQICQRHMAEALGTKDRGILEGKDIYLIEKMEVPIALLELGFMTNEDDMRMLGGSENQKKAAEAVCASIQEALEYRSKVGEAGEAVDTAEWSKK